MAAAYLIMGHGSEGDIEDDRVPPGCSLVVRVQPGESISSPFPLFFTNPDQEIYTKPDGGAIVRRHGSVAIFREGDKYPNFNYTLLADWDKGNKTQLGQAGIVRGPFNALPYKGYMLANNNTLAKEVIPILYNESISPDHEMVEQNITNISYQLGKDEDKLTIVQFLNAAKHFEIFSITQREIFNRVRSGYLAPGVFYNFICRYLPLSNYVYTYNSGHIQTIDPELRQRLFETEGDFMRRHTLNRLNRYFHSGKKGYNLSKSEFRGRPNTATRRLLKGQIAETVRYRTPYVREAYEGIASAINQDELIEIFRSKIYTTDTNGFPIINTDVPSLRRLVKGLKKAGLNLDNVIMDTIGSLPPNLILGKILIEEGVNINNPELNLVTGKGAPIHDAAFIPLLDLLKFLIENSADLNIPNAKGDSALHIAVSRNKVRAIERLLAAGANVNIQNSMGDTPLMIAVENGNVALVRLLLAAGANLAIMNHMGLTARNMAREYEKNNVLAVIGGRRQRMRKTKRNKKN